MSLKANGSKVENKLAGQVYSYMRDHKNDLLPYFLIPNA